MDRRHMLTQSGMVLASSFSGGMAISDLYKKKNKPILKVCHVTDVHIRPEDNVPHRAKQCIRDIGNHSIDFFLNGGDSIHDASYADVGKQRVLDQWLKWDEWSAEISDFEIYSCLGNHDMWWAAPSKYDAMYGKAYAVSRLKIPNRYYWFEKKGWHFIILDSNNENVTLDSEQWNWLVDLLETWPANTPVVIMSHYPILGVTHHYVGGQHGDFKKLTALFYKHRDKVKFCLSGHQHMLDVTRYNGIYYFCNGALSGYWWGKGDNESAGPGYYLQTPPGFAILELYNDGHFVNTYYPHTF
ncbi:metallophosphoesterase family protein [Membranihabitans marinus]|uniref:metallophosphoesterase family protein n=1 Tax=Membranihabitans marinus TaxID=1227546 RepID=UPI001F473DE4|nr:metallophosphoesterase [Membranihabitans marinus]